MRTSESTIAIRLPRMVQVVLSFLELKLTWVLDANVLSMGLAVATSQVR